MHVLEIKANFVFLVHCWTFIGVSHCSGISSPLPQQRYTSHPSKHYLAFTVGEDLCCVALCKRNLHVLCSTSSKLLIMTNGVAEFNYASYLNFLIILLCCPGLMSRCHIAFYPPCRRCRCSDLPVKTLRDLKSTFVVRSLSP